MTTDDRDERAIALRMPHAEAFVAHFGCGDAKMLASSASYHEPNEPEWLLCATQDKVTVWREFIPFTPTTQCADKQEYTLVARGWTPPPDRAEHYRTCKWCAAQMLKMRQQLAAVVAGSKSDEEAGKDPPPYSPI